MPLSDSARLSSVAADGSVMISEAAVGMRADGSVPSTRPSVVFGTLLRQPVSSAAHRASAAYAGKFVENVKLGLILFALPCIMGWYAKLFALARLQRRRNETTYHQPKGKLT